MPMNRTITLFSFLLFITGLQAQYYSAGQYEEGIAGYYADDLHGQATSCGEQYRREGFTAAHQHYAPGTIVRVTRLDNGQSVQVRVNDKMAPDNERRIILSRAAAMQIGLVSAGTLRVRIEKVAPSAPPTSYSGRRDSDYSSGNSQRNSLTARSAYIQPNAASGSNTQPAAASAYPSAYNAQAEYTRASGADVVRNSGRALAPGLSGYVIQLASYEDGANAVSSVNQLMKQGLQHVYIWEKDGKNRVVVARFQDKASAAEYLNTLRQKYLLDGIVVQLR